MEHVKWAIMTVHENVQEAKEKILKAYKMKNECKSLADWERDMAVAHINFNNSGARMAAEHIEKARESHAGDDRAMGMLDVWEQWLHHVAGEMAEVKAMIDSYK